MRGWRWRSSSLDDGRSHTFIAKDLYLDNATFATPDLTTFCRLGDLSLAVMGQHLSAEQAVLLYRPVNPGDGCHRCCCQTQVCDSVVRELAHVPFGWRPTTLRIRLRHYQCTACGPAWYQDLTRAASPRSCLSRAALRWTLGARVGGSSVTCLTATRHRREASDT